MTDPDKRFDALLDAMVNKPSLEASDKDEPQADDDKREEDES